MPDHVEDMKAGRVVVSEPRAGGSCIWYYEEGLLKNQVPVWGWEGTPGPQASASPPGGSLAQSGTGPVGPGEVEDAGADLASHAFLRASGSKQWLTQIRLRKPPVLISCVRTRILLVMIDSLHIFLGTYSVLGAGTVAVGRQKDLCPPEVYIPLGRDRNNLSEQNILLF